jgi:hypothetical protein
LTRKIRRRGNHFGLADKKSNGNTPNKERNRYTTGVIFRRECRKYREILFKFKEHQDLLFNHIRPSDMTSFIFWFVSNYVLKKFDPLKHETVFLAICCARRSTAAMWIFSIYRFLKWKDFCGNGDSTCRHCFTCYQRTSEQWDAILLPIYILNYICILKYNTILSFKLCFQCFMQTDIWILSKVFAYHRLILVAKYVESRYSIVDVVFAL